MAIVILTADRGARESPRSMPPPGSWASAAGRRRDPDQLQSTASCAIGLPRRRGAGIGCRVIDETVRTVRGPAQRLRRGARGRGWCVRRMRLEA
jgi:hypothetical protein